MQQSNQPERSSLDPLATFLLALGVLFALPCILLVLLSRWLPRRLLEWRGFWLLLALIGTCFIAGFFLVAHPLHTIPKQMEGVLSEAVREAKTNSWSIPRLWADLRPLWLESLLFAPAAALLAHLIAPRSAAQRLLTLRHQQEVALHVASKRVERRMRRKPPPDQVGKQIVLGLPVQGDLWEWVVRRLFILPIAELSKHGVVIGKSGSGKSETLLRLAVGVARILGWQVIMIDGKGDHEAGLRFCAAMKSAGIQNVKMFPAEAYNGWVGSQEALLSRLLAVEEYSDTHYRAIAENLLRLAISASGQPISNSAELLLRLNLTNEVLLGLYAGNSEVEAYLTYYSKRDPLGVYNRYAALLAKLGGKLDGEWSFDSVDAAYISLDGLALSGIVSGLGRYYVEDFANYAGQRKPLERRVLFIFDELGAIDANLANMFERVRSRGVSVYVSGQSDHSIAYRGMMQNAERILSAATTIILHASNDPERIIGRAGTLFTVEEVSGVEGDETTGRGSLRLSEVPKIDANVIRQLPTGEAYVIAHGKAHHVRVMPVPIGSNEMADVQVFAQPAQSDLPLSLGLVEPVSTSDKLTPPTNMVKKSSTQLSQQEGVKHKRDDDFLT
jgi:hypothetical protein